MNRRDFLKLSAVTGLGLFLPVRQADGRRKYIFVPDASAKAVIDPVIVDKYVTPLIVPPAMPRVDEITLDDGTAADYYEITMVQFEQDILPPGTAPNPTPVWSYVKADDPDTYNYPGFTIEAELNKPVRVKWINGLVDESGNYLPHLLPVDQTLHWANPPGPVDSEPATPGTYTGPVPMVTHVHGAHTYEESDGYPEAWYLPDAANIPSGYFTGGTFYNPFKQNFLERWGVEWDPGSATFQYPNDTRPTTLWFHDHVLGITRLNVYAGPAAFYLLRGGPDDLPAGTLPGPAPGVGDDPFGTYYEIPLAIQDRSFNDDGTLFYPDNRAFFEGLDPAQLQIPFTPDVACDGRMSDVPPIWNPEFFGNSMVVNGRTWPYLEVEQRRYRFRMLNGCNSRFLILKMVTGDPSVRPATAQLPFWVIGTDGGFIAQPEQLNELLMGPAERYDVIVDFSEFAEGTEIFLINEAPDEPFGGGVPDVDFDYANPLTTGQVMKFVVVPVIGEDTSTDPAALTLPAVPALPAEDLTRPLALIEEDSRTVRVIEDESGNIVLACDDEDAEFFGPAEAHLGLTSETASPVSLDWHDDPTEYPYLNSTEVWELYNFTADAHPIHVHLVQFEVVNRQALETDEEGHAIAPPVLVGDPRAPESWEMGLKDTVIAYPGEVTRIRAHFDIPGLFVWHCHILEHEDNEMMRPYRIIDRKYIPLMFKEGDPTSAE